MECESPCVVRWRCHFPSFLFMNVHVHDIRDYNQGLLSLVDLLYVVTGGYMGMILTVSK